MKPGKATYLVVRIGDNDFTTFAEALAKALTAMFYLYDYPKTEADLELLKVPVARLWAALCLGTECPLRIVTTITDAKKDWEAVCERMYDFPV